jgi:hypothetical protein
MRAGAPWLDLCEPPRHVGVDPVRVVCHVHPRMALLHQDLDRRLGGVVPAFPVIARMAASVCADAAITDPQVPQALANLVRYHGIHPRHDGGLWAERHGQTFAIFDRSAHHLVDLDAVAVLVEHYPSGPAVRLVGEHEALRRMLRDRVDLYRTGSNSSQRVCSERPEVLTHAAWTESGVTKLLKLLEGVASVSEDDLSAFRSASNEIYQTILDSPGATVTGLNPTSLH